MRPRVTRVFASATNVRATLFCQDPYVALTDPQIALGTMAAFTASVLAGVLAAPVARILGTAEADALTVRALVALGGVVGALSVVPVLFIRDVPVPRAVPSHTGRLLPRFIVIEATLGIGAFSIAIAAVAWTLVQRDGELRPG